MACPRCLLDVLDELDSADLKRFVFLLANGAERRESVPRGRLEGETREGIASLLHERFANRALDVTREILLEVPRLDLVKKMFSVSEDDARGKRKRATPDGEDIAGNVRGTLAPKRNREISKTLTDKQLMRLATRMGDNWKQIGIQFLGLQDYEIQRCRSETCPVMQIFNMLRLWRDRGKNGSTASQLHSILANRECPISSECIDWLEEEN